MRVNATRSGNAMKVRITLEIYEGVDESKRNAACRGHDDVGVGVFGGRQSRVQVGT